MPARKFVFVFLLFVITLLGSFFALDHGYIALSAFGKTPGSATLLAPLPDFLAIVMNKQVATLDLWHPSADVVDNSLIKKPDILAASAMLYDTTANKILFQKNTKKQLPMASLTKVMTAIIGLENPKSDDEYVVHQNDIVGEDSMGLSANEKLPLEDLLYGLFLHSGNDAAETIASNYAGGRSTFVRAMNEKVKALGLTNTHFTNPTGLEGDGDQYTTANDLLIITEYGLTHFPQFAKVAETSSFTISQTTTHKEYDLENETNLLTSYPGVKGVKTGYTPEAGLCLITYLDYDEHKIIGVLLNSENRRDDMKELLDYGLKIQNITPPKHT